MATADHTPFTQARMGSVSRVKRQPAKFQVRDRSAFRRYSASSAARHRSQSSNLLISGLLLIAVAYWLGLLMGAAALRP
ncbi:MAG: hypothetical protein K2X03_25755 [Bryobacteraceae bacterium]|nr:hypothetical protein [Bryobacteraceae bacterium]